MVPLAGGDAYSEGGRAGEVGVAGRCVKLVGGSGKGSVLRCGCDLYGGKGVESWGGDGFGVGWFLLASLGAPENWDIKDKTVPTEEDLVSIMRTRLAAIPPGQKVILPPDAQVIGQDRRTGGMGRGVARERGGGRRWTSRAIMGWMGMGRDEEGPQMNGKTKPGSGYRWSRTS